MKEKADEKNARFILLLMPPFSTIYIHTELLSEARRETESKHYSIILDEITVFARESSIEMLNPIPDLQVAAEQFGVEIFSPNGSHPSDLGNQILADSIYRHLKNQVSQK